MCDLTKIENKYSPKTFLMNPHTGNVDTWQNWFVEASANHEDWEEENDQSATQQLLNLIEVQKDKNGHWIEV